MGWGCFPVLVYIIPRWEEGTIDIMFQWKRSILTKKRVYPQLLIIHTSGNKEAQITQNDRIELSFPFCLKRKSENHTPSLQLSPALSCCQKQFRKDEDLARMGQEKVLEAQSPLS